MAKVQTIAAVVTAAGVVILLLGLLESRAQRRVMEAEIAARMRPWVGAFSVAMAADNPDCLLAVVRNFGPLPALAAHLAFTIGTTSNDLNPDGESILWEETPGAKALMPGEEGNYRIDLSDRAEFQAWRVSRRHLIAVGSVSYAHAGLLHMTKVEAVLVSDPLNEEPRYVVKRWRNTDAL